MRIFGPITKQCELGQNEFVDFCAWYNGFSELMTNVDVANTWTRQFAAFCVPPVVSRKTGRGESKKGESKRIRY